MTITAGPSDVADFEAHRRALTGLAYRMLGSRAEAEDVVQDLSALACQRPRRDRRAASLSRHGGHATRPAARKRRRPDAEIAFGGEVSFRSFPLWPLYSITS